MGSHSVTCHPTRVNMPCLKLSQIGRYSIYRPQRDGTLSWSKRLVTYQDGLPACRQARIQVLTRPTVEQLCWSDTMYCCYTITHHQPNWLLGNFTLYYWGPSPSRKKNGGPKTCKIWHDFGWLPYNHEYLGTDRDIQNRTSTSAKIFWWTLVH